MLDEAAPLLAGAIVQRVDPTPDLWIVRLRAPGATFFVLIASGRPGLLVGLSRTRPFKGAAPGAAEGGAPLGEKLRARARLAGARIAALGERRVLFTSAAGALVIEASPTSGARVVLREVDDAESGALAAEAARAADLEALCAQGERLARALGEGALAARRQDLARSIARGLVKLERRIAAIEGDLARIAEAGALAAQASAFVAEASRAPRGATSLSVIDWSTGEARPVTIALDPAKSARSQLDAMFARARRLKQGGVIGRQRLAQAESAWEALGALAIEVPSAADFEALDALLRRARAAAPKEIALGPRAVVPTSGSGARATPSRPYRTFRGAAGKVILVGKGAAANDALTFHVGRPHDLWLHARGRAGAHVIVPLDRGQVCPSDLLIEAALLAAHFSEARDETLVEVEHTPRRYVRKPRGAAPGLVVVEREKVLGLRVERDALAALLAREELG